MDGPIVALTVIAAYDVANDNRRARLAALLQTWGDRVQESVFILTLGDEDLADLRGRAILLLDVHEDSLYFFRQCATCWDSLYCVGQASPPKDELYWSAL